MSSAAASEAVPTGSTPLSHIPVPGGPKLWLLRHGETEWSRSGQYTGLTDLPLTPEGEDQARSARPALLGNHFDLVLTSPLQRARRTAELAGYPEAEVEPNAVEWNYGDYEGINSAVVRAENPGYLIWDSGVPNGNRWPRWRPAPTPLSTGCAPPSPTAALRPTCCSWRTGTSCASSRPAGWGSTPAKAGTLCWAPPRSAPSGGTR